MSVSGFFLWPTNLIAAINNKLMPLKTVLPDSDFSDLENLRSILTDKRIVLLGEATHGTHEFFTFKHRMLEFLVNEMDFKTFVIEADFTGTQAMNDYVLYGKGTSMEALKKMSIGVWFTGEFMDMIEWIKKYNSSQPFQNKIKFYGCDMQWAINSGSYLTDGTIKLQHPLSATAQKGLDVIIAYRYGEMDKKKITLLNATAKELMQATVIETDITKLMLYKRIILNILQTIEYCQPKYLYDKSIIRDKYMAGNCEWIYNFESKNKMVVWAANAHVAKYPVKENNLPMGYYLTQKFQDESYVMGFGFNSGSFRGYNTDLKKYMISVVPDVQLKNSIDYIFNQCAVPNFILDLKSAKESPLINNFLNKKLNARMWGAEYTPNKQADGGDGNAYQALIKMYDGIVFIRNTTAVQPIKPD